MLAERARGRLERVRGRRKRDLPGNWSRVTGWDGTRARKGDRERRARDGISPVCQPASLVHAPGHPPALQVAIPSRLLPAFLRVLSRPFSFL